MQFIHFRNKRYDQLKLYIEFYQFGNILNQIKKI